MINSKLLPGWVTFALTLGLFFIGYQKGVTAKYQNNLDKLDSTKSTIAKASNGRSLKLPPQIISQGNFPNPIPPRTPEPPVRNPTPRSQPPVELDPAPSNTSPDLLEIPGAIAVKEFKFEGNTAFSDEELKQALKELTGKPISFAELLQAEEIIKNLYTAGCQGEGDRSCYINSGAFIPARSKLLARRGR